MPRPPYSDLPPELRAEVDALLGSPVVDAVTQPGGFSPGVAARVRCADGRRAFVKAVSSLANPRTPDLHRAEARVVAALPPALGSPGLLGSWDDGTWVVLLLDDVEGREPTVPDDLSAVLAAVDRLGQVPAPESVPGVEQVLGEEFHGWRTLASAPDHLESWQAEHLDELVRLEQGWAAAGQGDRLLHLDLRTDNMLVRADGTVALVDWAWAARGAPLLDVVLLAVGLQGAGPEDLLQRTAAGRAADPRDVDRLVATVCGRMVEHARRPPPPGLATVRALQAAQGRVSGDWLRARLGWP